MPKKKEKEGVVGISLCDSDVEELEGVGKETAAKLRAAGIYTVRDLAFASRAMLKEYGIGDETAYKLIRKAIKECNMDVVMPADTITRSPQRLSSLVHSIDEVLEGGFAVGNMYELIGEYGTGKTQMCFQLSIAATLPIESGGLGGSVLFMDTEGTFRVNRIEEIAKHREIDPSNVLSKIYVARVFTPDHLELLLHETVPKIIVEKGIKLIVIDSLIKLYRTSYIGRENLAERQQRLNVVLSRLNTLATRYGLVVVYTNQMVANPVPFGEQTRPAGGNVVAHAAQYRIALTKKGKLRILSVLDSPDIPPDRQACFTITSAGIEEAPCS
jgi:DNA repair protein RadA